jgi:hypothetical protein
MAKKALIAVVIFYLLGVFGVSAGYLTNNWEGDWGAGDQLADALRTGVSWPALVVDLIAGT